MINMKVFYVEVETDITGSVSMLLKDAPAITAALHGFVTEYANYKKEVEGVSSSEYEDIHDWISEIPVKLSKNIDVALSSPEFEIWIQSFNNIIEAEDDLLYSARAIIRGEEDE